MNCKLKVNNIFKIIVTLFISLQLTGCLASLLDLPGSAYRNETEQLKKLIKDGDDVNGFNSAGVAGIHYAAKAGNLKVLQILLDNGADVNLKAIDKYKGWTPLHFAMIVPKYHRKSSQYKKIEIVKLLVTKGAKLDYKGSNGESLLHIIASAQSYQDSDAITSFLIKYGVSVNAKDNNGKTPIDYALKNLNFSNMIVLMKNGAKLDYTGPNGSSILHLAAENILKNKDALRFIDYLISQGYDINAVDNEEQTVLHYTYEININEKDNRQRQGKEGALLLLISKGANPAAQDKYGNTIGHYAVCEENIQIVSLYRVLYKKYDLENIKNNKNKTIEELYTEYFNYMKNLRSKKTSAVDMLTMSPPSCI